MAKSYLSNGAFIAAGSASSNYVQQIAAGEGTFDIAVQNGIRFFNGQEDEEGILWDGVSPLEVVIPAITDIISDPVRFVGTVGADGIAKNGNDVISPVKGDLVYITANCTFASQACEAGDMAVYDGTAWRVISGENQVEIVGTEVSGVINHALGKTAQSVLTVEGKDLSLALNYDDIRNNITALKNGENTLSVGNGVVTVSSMYLALSQAASSSEDITTSMSIDLPSALADGAVTIDSVLQGSDFVFTSGSFPTISKNADAISVNASHNMTIAKDSAAGDFVTDVTAIKAISFDAGSNVSNDFSFVASLSSISGTSFVSGIHAYTNEDEGKNVDLNIWGQATVSNSTFVSGLSDAADSGDLVSAITVGSVSLDAAGEGILTGLSTEGSDVITSVSVGYAAEDATAQWFYSGLSANGSQVVTDVTVGAVSFVSGNSDGFTGSAIVSASVSNHVLLFTTGSFMTPVSLSKASDTIAKADFTKKGVKIEGTSISAKGFTTAALSQAATSVSFRSLLTDNVTLSQSSVSYFFDKAEDHNYEAVMGYVKANVTAADVTKNGAKIENPTITASIPANSVAVDVTGGTLPSLSIGNPTGTISGTVGTSLTTSVVSWLAVDESKKDIAVAGAYSLVSDSSVNGAIEIAAAGEYAVDGASVTIAEGTYVEAIYVDGSVVSDYEEPGA